MAKEEHPSWATARLTYEKLAHPLFASEKSPPVTIHLHKASLDHGEIVDGESLMVFSLSASQLGKLLAGQVVGATIGSIQGRAIAEPDDEDVTRALLEDYKQALEEALTPLRGAVQEFLIDLEGKTTWTQTERFALMRRATDALRMFTQAGPAILELFRQKQREMK